MYISFPLHFYFLIPQMTSVTRVENHHGSLHLDMLVHKKQQTQIVHKHPLVISSWSEIPFVSCSFGILSNCWMNFSSGAWLWRLWLWCLYWGPRSWREGCPERLCSLWCLFQSSSRASFSSRIMPRVRLMIYDRNQTAWVACCCCLSNWWRGEKFISFKDS